MQFEKGSIVLDYIVEDRIGKGSFAIVYKVTERKNPSAFFALKSVDIGSMGKKMLYNLDQEISIHKNLLHFNVVRLVASEKTPYNYNIILEYCLTDLSYLIKRKTYPIAAGIDIPSISFTGGEGLDANVCRILFAQMTGALQFCHQFNIIHRDLKPQNILIHPFVAVLDQFPKLSEAYLEVQHRLIDFKYLPMAKIADFGFAAILENDLAETICGSPLYMAPEVLRYEAYDYKADLWSLGVIAFEAVCGKVPYQASNHLELLRKIEKGKDVIVYPSYFPEDLKGVVGKLLRQAPQKRLGMEELTQLDGYSNALRLIPFDLSITPKVRSRVYHRRTSSLTSSMARSKDKAISKASYQSDVPQSVPIKDQRFIRQESFNKTPSYQNKIYLNSPPSAGKSDVFKSSSLQNYMSRKTSLNEILGTPRQAPLASPPQEIKTREEEEFIFLEKESFDTQMDKERRSMLFGSIPSERRSFANAKMDLSHSPSSIPSNTGDPDLRSITDDLPFAMDPATRSWGKRQDKSDSFYFNLTVEDLIVSAEEGVKHARQSMNAIADDLKSSAVSIFEELEKKVRRLMTLYEIFIGAMAKAHPAIAFRVGCLIVTMALQDVSFIQKCLYAIRKHLKLLMEWHTDLVSLIYIKLQHIHEAHTEFAEIDYVKDYASLLYQQALDHLKTGLQTSQVRSLEKSIDVLEAMLLYPDPLSLLVRMELPLSIKQYLKDLEPSIIDAMGIATKKLAF